MNGFNQGSIGPGGSFPEGVLHLGPCVFNGVVFGRVWRCVKEGNAMKVSESLRFNGVMTSEVVENQRLSWLHGGEQGIMKEVQEVGLLHATLDGIDGDHSLGSEGADDGHVSSVSTGPPTEGSAPAL